MNKIIITIAILFLSFVSANAQNKCVYWFSRVDYDVKLPENYKNPDETNTWEVMQGIECLLQLEGNRKWAKFSGATRNEVSQTFAFASVEVAALYYASYLYYQSFDSFTDAVVLRNDDNEKLSTRKSVRKAYKYYRKWFEQVKLVGLEKAREQKLEPLKDKDVSWY